MLQAFLEDEALKLEKTFLRELSIKNQEVLIHLRKLKLAEQEKSRMKVEVDFLKSRVETLESKVLQLNVEQMISKEFEKFKNCTPRIDKEEKRESERDVIVSKKAKLLQDQQNKQTSEDQQNKQTLEDQQNKQTSENQQNKQTPQNQKIKQTPQNQQNKQPLDNEQNKKMSENQQNKQISVNQQKRQRESVEDAENSGKPKEKKSTFERKIRKSLISKKNTDDKIKRNLNATKKRMLFEKKELKKKKLLAQNKSKKIKISSGAKGDLGGQIININILRKEKSKNVVAKESNVLPNAKRNQPKKKKKNYKKISENGKSVYLCQKCDLKASTLYQMKKHMAAEHLSIVRFSCDECDYQTISKQNHAFHKQRKHKAHQATSSQG